MKSIRVLALAVGLGVLLVPPVARSSVAEVPALTAKVNALPTAEDVPFEVNMNLIIEFYR